jgi:hypothetical protein
MKNATKNKQTPISAVRDISNLIKKEPFSVLVILTLIFLPAVFSLWEKHFSEVWYIYIDTIVLALWVFSLVRLRAESIVWRNKTILLNLLKKDKRRTIEYLTTEWDGRKDFTDKSINEVLLQYPDIFKRVKVGRNGTWHPGITLVKHGNDSKMTEDGQN